ncbi:DNA polymerase III subunit epsilon [Achromobacter xylosoxidans]|uniref:hypothetical protein n=1 Tax=Achromobacter TaxID=222 RepID=UPI0006C2B6E6|nr:MULTISPECIES: hypothetical protein [Achromobacter]CAB3920439.1 hypothetical protein LMG26846_05557 [Achromobacter insuavis]CUJ32576.1 DNA polymerase III subunit epsilon [Achromobacter xylosoxidans]CUJ40566.1 DNA polymerase III subunit epsilon [Achromobacter sp. 2789STDY5608621]
MLTLNSNDIHEALRSIAAMAFEANSVMLRSFTVEIVPKEMRSRHGDYHLVTRKIRVFNLSRPAAHVVKTAVHELAHHVDCCLYGRTGHDKQFYTTYKLLLETGHRMGVIDLAVVTDAIGLRDIAQLEKSVGRLDFKPAVRKEGWVIKVDNAFRFKDSLKERGYSYSSTERAWVIECDDSILADETGWLHEHLESKNVRVLAAAANEIDSIYFCVLGKVGLFQHKDVLKADGFSFHAQHGWYKRVLAREQANMTTLLHGKYGVTPKFRGGL